jgi:hypothetical protein
MKKSLTATNQTESLIEKIATALWASEVSQDRIRAESESVGVPSEMHKPNCGRIVISGT